MIFLNANQNIILGLISESLPYFKKLRDLYLE